MLDQNSILQCLLIFGIIIILTINIIVELMLLPQAFDSLCLGQKGFESFFDKQETSF